MRPRTKILASAGILFVSIVMVALFKMGGQTVYTTESCIIAQPFTNVIYTRSFEKEMIQTFPGVYRLRVTPAFTGPPGGLNVLRATNGIAIHISTVGSSAASAITSANAAADGMGQRISANYRVNVHLLQEAHRAYPCSYLVYALSTSINGRGNQ